MSFFIAGVILWMLLFTGIGLLVAGLWKSSWRMVLGSGVAFLLPMFLIASGDGGILFKLTALVPFVVIGLAFYMKKRTVYFP